MIRVSDIPNFDQLSELVHLPEISRDFAQAPPFSRWFVLSVLHGITKPIW